MNHLLTEEQKELQQLARKIARQAIAPVAAEYDEEEKFPWPIIKIMAQADIFRVFIPEEYEGLSSGVFDLTIVAEELSRIDGGIALAVAGSALGSTPILVLGSEEQKRKYLPRLASGEVLAAFALTEADAGSDASAVKTTARKVGDKYILNGTKQWITNGGEAKIYTVIANTNPERGARGLSAFIVEEGTPGFTYGKKEKKMGIRASSTRELVFQDCEIPAENLLGKEGFGFIGTMRTFDRTRPGVAAQALGIAQGAFDVAMRYSQVREQFGTKIGSFQAIQFMLADMAIQIEAGRALLYNTCRLIDSGSTEISKASAMAKTFCSDMAMRVTTDAVQILGGYGYMREYPVEKMMRDAKITQIYEGTNQIQRLVIAAELVRELNKGYFG